MTTAEQTSSTVTSVTEASTEESTGENTQETSSESSSTESTTAATNEDGTQTEPPGIKKLSNMLDPAEAPSRQQSVEEARMDYQESFGGVDMNKAYESLFEILWYSQLPCFDVQNITSKERDEMSMIKRCFWKGELMNCASIFTTRPTDRGMCCSFNMAAADQVYRKSKYADALNKLQEQDKNLSFPAAKLEATTIQDIQPQAGLKKGLVLILDAHTNFVSGGTVFDNFRGFLTTISSPKQFPMTTKNSLLIKPGQYNTVGITALSVKADDAIKEYSPSLRNCYFSDESPLKMHKTYSQTNCLLECSLEYAAQNVARKGTNFTECIPWFYPVNDGDNRMCDPWEQKAFQELMGAVPTDLCDRCLPDCVDNIFETRVTAATFRKCDHTNLGTSMLCDLETGDLNPSIWSQEARDEFKAKMGDVPNYLLRNPENKTKLTNRRFYVPDPEKRSKVAFQEYRSKDPTYDAFDNDIAMVNFYFERGNVLQFNRALRMTVSDYVSQVGGMLGLGLGFSLMSAAEIIYWFTIRLWQNMSTDENGKSKKRTKSSRVGTANL